MSMEDEERARNLSALRELAGKVPAHHSTWSYQRTLDFKAAIQRASKVLAKKATNFEIAATLNGLRRFHDQQEQKA